MWKKLYSFVLICILVCSGCVSAGRINQLSPEEKKQGFKLLFDGKSMDKWRNYKSKTIRPQWQIIDEAMVLTEKGGKDIVTKEKFDYFDFRLQWNIAEGGNSGIMFRVDESTTKRLPWMVAPEFQLKDRYGKPRKSAGALYGLVAVPEGIAKKAGEWNTTRILLAPGPNGREQLKCWLNDTQTVDLVIDHAPDSEWSKLIKRRNKEKDVAGTKFELPAEFFKTTTGPILLQDHGARVAFRNIRIRKLPTIALLATSEAGKVSVIPRPVSAEYSEGFFTITPATLVIAEDKAATEAQKLIDTLAPAMGFRLKLATSSGPQDRVIRFELSDKLPQIGNEGYTLDVTAKSIVIRAAKPAGLFYGSQTLRQLLPASVFSKTKVKGVTWKVPSVMITDYPRFKWRGLLVDPARHFIPKPDLLRFIDAMALHKLNSLQIHLTDDQGWRIEIKKYPKLTEVGAWRDETLIGHLHKGPLLFDGKRHGGFYTQADIREIVRYASARHINIVPEIEMPGHARAAISSYPHLGVFPEKQKDIRVWTRWGVSGDIFAPRPRTIAFLQNVLTEVMQLFPSKYIHIGGDEAVKNHWKASEEFQALIRDKGLKDEAKLQSWFIKQMDTFLTKNGRRLVGWDDILQGGLAPGAVVMSWRGETGGITSANAGHDVVMAPTSHTYFDYYQGPADKEPLAIGGYVPLEKVYQYEPIPKAIDADKAGHVLGLQAQLWSEYIPDPQHLEYMAYPRAAALAEVGWSPKSLKDYDDFLARLRQHIQRLKAMDIRYRPLD